MGNNIGESGGRARGPSGRGRGPSGVYSEGKTGKSDVTWTNIADGPGEIGRDPSTSKAQPATVREKRVNQSSDTNLTWEQRTLLLLSQLIAARGFKDLHSRLKDEVRKLIDDAPDSARS